MRSTKRLLIDNICCRNLNFIILHLIEKKIMRRVTAKKKDLDVNLK